MRMRAIGARQAAREVGQTATATTRAGRAATGASRSYKAASKETGIFSGRMRGMIGLGKDAAIALGLFGLAGSIKSITDGAEQWQQVQRQTNATLKATGSGAWTSRKQIEEMANEIGDLTAVNRDAIQSSANMLLTFRNVRGPKMFHDSLSAIVAVQAQFHKAGKDTTKVPVQIGKALNNPIKGLTALTRIGVAFTDQQKEQITAMAQSGNMMGAQKAILKELNREFKAPRPTPWQQLTYSLDNLRRAAGIALLPTINKMIKGLAKFAVGIEHGTGAGGKFRDIMSRIGRVLAGAWKLVKKNHDLVVVLGAAVLGAVAAWKAFLIVNGVIQAMKKAVIAYKLLTGATTAEEAAQMGLNAALLANPVGLVIVAVGALIGVFVLAYMKVKWFRNAVNAVFHAIVTFVRKHWKLMLAILLGPFGLVILGVIKFRTKIWHVIKTVVHGIIGFFKAVPHGIQGIFNGVINFFIRRINDLIGIINGAIKAYNKIPLAPNIGTIPKIGLLGKKKPPGHPGPGHPGTPPPRAPGQNVFRRGVGQETLWAARPRSRGDWSGSGPSAQASSRPQVHHLHATIESPIYLDGRLVGKSVRRASLHAKAVT